ncbi:LysR substrate-binding domain-containing protein [Sabulicella glaciei]|uniref:LysR substrate-binding domain-containing protein n=1 Tax=Sabulicella glaciei TaxID=2984948 RepID=A0ABT3NTU2_9PROT|nr:LysR substrate-binding domain-containing protein [Roseococcus sp. MDT2-1-1]MCW8085582.1 LysR substrate-binding domain-containing protein [Roseococcus sp. MDT2-1-1]
MAERLPPLPALHAFVLVAETGSLSAAAARLNVTQPAVGKRIRALEAALGRRLLLRGANSATLTEDGARYAEALRAAFARMEEATAELRQPSGPLRVRAYTTWAMRWLIPRLPRFRVLHPGVEIEVSASTAPVDFARDAVDAAIRTGRQLPGAIRLQPLAIQPFAAPALARAVRRVGLAPHSLLGSRVRPRDWATWADTAGITLPGTPLLFESTSLAVQAALEGLGIVIVSPELVAEDVRRRRLLAISGPAVGTGDHYWLLMPSGIQHPGASAFRDWLLEEMRGDGAAFAPSSVLA